MSQFMIGPKDLVPRHLLPLLLTLGTALVLVVGCDRGPKRYHLSGEVRFDGKPVPAGEIYFDPDFTKSHDGPQGFARIKNGRYDTREGGLPVTPGPYVVRISGFDGKARPAEDVLFGQRLFAPYQTTADVPDGGDATLNFDVPSRGQTP